MNIEKLGKKILISLIIIPPLIIGFIIFDSVRSKNKEEALRQLESISEDISTDTPADEITAAIEEIQNTSSDKYILDKSKFILALWHAENQRWAEAQEIYTEIANDSRSYLGEISLYNGAIAAEEASDLEQASDLLGEFINRYGDGSSPLLGRALFTIARISEKQGDTDTALDYYMRVVVEHADSEWVNLANSQIARLQASQ